MKPRALLFLLALLLLAPASAQALTLFDPDDPSSPGVSATPASGAAPLFVTFTLRAPGGNYVFHFGDGTKTGEFAMPAASCDGGRCTLGVRSVTHTYVSAGSFSARLIKDGQTEPTASVTVSVGSSGGSPPPATGTQPRCSMSASAGAVTVGQTVNLTWSSTNATEGSITSIGPVPLSGKQGVIPLPPSTTYTGTFVGAGGKATCAVTVLVLSGNGGFGGDRVPPPTDTGGGGGGGSGGPFPTTPGGSTPLPDSGPSTGIVPCDGLDCQACHLASLGQRIINFLLGLSIPLATALFAWAGILLFTSQGSTERMARAKGIFKAMLIGFLIVLGSWLLIQTALETILKKDYYKSWNSIQCVDDDWRPRNATLAELLRSISALNLLNTTARQVEPENLAYYGGTGASGSQLQYDDATGCALGSQWNSTFNMCVDGEGNFSNPVGFTGGFKPYQDPNGVYTQCYGSHPLQDGMCQGDEGAYPPFARSNSRSGPEGVCEAGYRYAEDDEYAWCQGPAGADDIRDFRPPGNGGGPTVTCDLATEGCADVNGARANYMGRDTSAGPDYGNLACAWSVNNILRDAGIAPIDGNSVQSMREQLDGGRGEQIGYGEAQAGDIIIWQGVGANGRRVSHVGFCENDGCTETSSNSSSERRYGMNGYGSRLNGVTGVVYRINR